MAREIYEIKLAESYFPATSHDEALEMLKMLDEDAAKGALRVGIVINEVVKEEHTMKLFMLAKTMYDTERFEAHEVEASVGALARELGYWRNYAEVTDCVLTWVERFDEMSIADLEEWLIS